MVKKVIKKEFALNFPKALWLFLLLSALVVIPNYPLIVSVGYAIMPIGIMLSYSKENRDLDFSLTLPVSRNDVAAGRILSLTVYELLHLAAVALFCPLSAYLINPNGNLVGLDANLTLLAAGLLCMGVFNAVAFPAFYKTGHKAALPLFMGASAFAGVYVAVELLIQLIPQLRNVLDSTAFYGIGYRAAALALGAAAFAALTYFAVRRSQNNFSRVNA